jgi:hypothetical protein
MHEQFIATLVIVTMFCLLAILLTLLFMRHRNQQFLHQERLAAIEKGTTIPNGRSTGVWSPRVYYLRGLMWTFGGAALTIFLFGVAVATHRPASEESMLWHAGTLSQAAHIPLEEARQAVQKDQSRYTEGPSPAIALLGLIPLGVGIAYLIFYKSGENAPTPRE